MMTERTTMDDPTTDPSDVHELDVDDLAAADLEQATREALRAVGGEPAPAAGGASSREEPSQREAQLAADLASERERSLRLLADFDNFRKRADRERDEVRRYALVEPLRELLGVVDNLERALLAQGSLEDWKRGVEMIDKQLRDLLRRFQVQEVAADGQPFDPAVHEAVARTEDPGVEVAQVVEVFQRGYRLHDRLLRPAMVKVAVPASHRPAGAPPVPPGDPATET
jgi:molecular chaperone GrpE